MIALSILTGAASIILTLVAEYFSVSGLLVVFPADREAVIAYGLALALGRLVLAALSACRRGVLAERSTQIGIRGFLALLMIVTFANVFERLSEAHAPLVAPSVASGDVLAPLHEERALAQAEMRRLDAQQAALDVVIQQRIDAGRTTAANDERAKQARERADIAARRDAASATLVRGAQTVAALQRDAAQAEAKRAPMRNLAGVLGIADPEAVVRALIAALALSCDPLAVFLMHLAASMLVRRSVPEEGDKAAIIVPLAAASPAPVIVPQALPEGSPLPTPKSAPLLRPVATEWPGRMPGEGFGERLTARKSRKTS